MFSGTNLIPLAGYDRRFGVHQRIDRIARRHLAALDGDLSFPPIDDILRFEGYGGPDGIKRKSPGRDEPWHYYDPKDKKDTNLIDIIDSHYRELVGSLKAANDTRAAFEAAWLAHAVVDGLTPAHHYPYEAELTRLRGGAGLETRVSVKEKLLAHGDTWYRRILNNWRIWGDKGLLATHFAFEWGIATMIPVLRLESARPTAAELKLARQKTPAQLFKARAAQVAELNMYDAFYRGGWTVTLANQVRVELLPLIVNTLTLIWYRAALDAAKR